jgi:Mg/Co/Ni transporter MgtE
LAVEVCANLADGLLHHPQPALAILLERQGLLVGQIGTREAAALDRILWPSTAVGRIMQPCAQDQLIGPDLDVFAALRRMQRSKLTRLFVVQDGRLLGVVTVRDMIELLSTKIELDATRRIAGGTPLHASHARAAREGRALRL